MDVPGEPCEPLGLVVTMGSWAPWSPWAHLREFVVNSRNTKTPARGLGGSVLRLLTPFPGNPGHPGNPGNPRMSSRIAEFGVNNSICGHACSRML